MAKPQAKTEKKKKRVKNKGTGDALAKLASTTEEFKKEPLKNPPQVNPEGRPTDYKPEFCKLLVEHMSKGMSFESFAAEDQVDCSERTLYNWRDSHSEFFQAYEKGYARCMSFWEKLGLGGVGGKIKGFKEATYIYNMNNRFKKHWKNTMHVSKDDAPEEHSDNAVRDVTPDLPIEEKVKAILVKLKNDF